MEESGLMNLDNLAPTVYCFYHEQGCKREGFPLVLSLSYLPTPSPFQLCELQKKNPKYLNIIHVYQPLCAINVQRVNKYFELCNPHLVLVTDFFFLKQRFDNIETILK